MKTYLTYGFAIALAGALLNLILYFAGFHSDPSKLTAAQVLGGVIGIAITVIGIVLGTRARRAETPPTEEFGYGRALVAGIMISLFAALLGIVTGYIYLHVINSGFNDLIVQSKISEMEAKGLGGPQLEQMEKMLRLMTSAPVQAAMGFLGAMFFGTLVSLITAAVLKRSTSEQPPITA
jgi:hypothetical protein